jgi:putative ribosome biogenesis GTPase RsgA
MGFGKGLIIGALGALGAVFAAAAISVIREDRRNKMASATDNDLDEKSDADSNKQIVVTGRSGSGKTKLISLLKSEDNEITFKEISFSPEYIADNCSEMKSNLIHSDSLIYCISMDNQSSEDISTINTFVNSGIKVVVVLTKGDIVSKEQADTFEHAVAEAFSNNESVIVIGESDDAKSKILDAVMLEE